MQYVCSAALSDESTAYTDGRVMNYDQQQAGYIDMPQHCAAFTAYRLTKTAIDITAGATL